MSKILTRLRNWGESLFTSKKAFIAEQSLPQFQVASEQSVVCTEGYEQLTPTINGYVSIEAIDSDTNCRFRACLKDPNDTTDLISSSNYKWSTAIYSVYLPVRKGGKVVMVYSNDNAHPLRVRWISNMGGGGVLKETAQLLQGGFLCLKASLNLRLIATAESFCRQETIVFMKRFLSVKRKALTLCLMMAFVCLPATVCSLRLIIKQAVEQSLCTQAKATSFIKQRVSLAQKAIKLSGSFGNTKAAQQLCTFSTLALIKANYRKETVYG